jgi:hypothetical protein
MGLCSPHSTLAIIIHGKLPSNRLSHTQFQIMLLNSQEHEDNDVLTEPIGSLFNKLGTPLARPMHFCKTGISIVGT